MGLRPLQTAWFVGVWERLKRTPAALEAWLETERDQLPLWLPVAVASGIGAWFALPDPAAWLALICGALGLAAVAAMIPGGGRIGAVIGGGGLSVAAGCLLIWGTAVAFGTRPIERPIYGLFTGRVQAVERIAARDQVRLRLRLADRPDMPGPIRVNVASKDLIPGIARGTVVEVRARLVPPPGADIPGAYDFAPVAYFGGLSATGKALPPLRIVSGAGGQGKGIRERLGAYIHTRLSGPPATIAVTLANGDQGEISQEDADAMRRSGLAHLLSISGLHVTALIGAVFFLVLKLLALSRRLALDWPLMLIAAAAGALAGIGYTLLTGSQVPTVRSVISAILVLGALAMGREALTLRLIAAGALFVMIFWPDAVVGPSFQLSFAAVVAIVALHEAPGIRRLLARRDESWVRRLGRELLSLLLTGIAVEAALAPIALYHFHRSGIYGALANLVAIPLSTFVIMPAEAAALLLDTVHLGAPFWWLTGKAITLLLWVAHFVASRPGAVTLIPLFPTLAYLACLFGMLWMALWRSRARWLGLTALVAGLAFMLTSPPPDLLVTGDGRHVAARTDSGSLAILRGRAGDYVRDMLSESAGYEGELPAFEDLPTAQCNDDLCRLDRTIDGRHYSLLATRGSVSLPVADLVRDCAAVDVVVSDRRLPRDCNPRWLKLDRASLARSGGIALYWRTGKVRTVRSAAEAHPWMSRPDSAVGNRPAIPFDRLRTQPANTGGMQASTP